MKKYYVVTVAGGQWEDSWDYIAGIFEDENEACGYGLKLFKEYVKDKEIPDDLYEAHIDEFYVWEEVQGDDEYSSYDPIFKDAYGYTAEQWEKDYDARNYNADVAYVQITAYQEKCREFEIIRTITNNYF